MRGRQVGALVLAAVLIAGAWLVRTQVIDGDADAGPSSNSSTVVCVPELKAICSAALAGNDQVTLRIESANVTLDARSNADLPSDEIWITLQPFPAMVDRLRTQQRLVATEETVETIAASPLVLVVAAERAESLAIGCGQPVRWACLGDAAGGPWTILDPNASAGDVRPAFAPHPDTAIGQIGVASALLGYFGGSNIDASDPGLITWARSLARAANPSTVAGSTAVTVIQTRSSAFDVAVGAAAELSDLDDPRFALVQADPAVTVDIVATVPAGSAAPSGLVADLRSAAETAGWSPPQSGSMGISADDMLLSRRLWEELT